MDTKWTVSEGVDSSDSADQIDNSLHEEKARALCLR